MSDTKKYPETVTIVSTYGMGRLGFIDRLLNCINLLRGKYLDDVHMVYTRESIEEAMRLLNTPISKEKQTK